MVEVCHIISGDLWAGAEVMAFHLLKGLTKYRDLGLSTILLNEGRLAEELRGLKIPVVVIDENKESFFQIFLAIKKALNRRPPDVIHSHRYKENIFAYLFSKTKKRVKLIATQHGLPELEDGNRSLKHRLISKLNYLMLSKWFQNIAAVSKDIQRVFVDQYGFSEDKVKVIHNGIEILETIPGKREKGTFSIGSSGRLFPVKDYPFMVEIANEVFKKTDGIRFELAGDGPEMAKIHDVIQKYGLEKVFGLWGFVKDMPAFYQELDLYLNTSLNEGIPISILEAMAYGIPVIAPDVGGLKEILKDGVEGFLIEGRNPKDFAEKCLELYLNKPLRNQMAFAVREKVLQEFSIGRMAEEYYNLYRYVLRIK